MFQTIQKAILAAAAGAVKTEVDSLTSGAKGQQKLDTAVQTACKLLDGLVPGWAAPILNTILPVLVEAAVSYFNHSGFFGPSGISSTSSPATS